MTKHELEADLVGLLLISAATPEFGASYQNYKLYQCNVCYHRQYFQPTHVRRNSAKCSNCNEIRLKEEAESVGLTYIGLPSNSDPAFKRYKFNNCNHFVDLRHSSVFLRVGESCKECYEDKLKAEADAKGLIYLGASELKSTYRKYQFKSCSHIKDIQAPCVAVGRFECKDCIDDEYKRLCAENGLDFVKKLENRYWTFKLPCGHAKDLRVDHAVEDSWLCDKCGDSHYTKPSNLYIYEFVGEDFSWLKFGFARNLSTRRANYGVSSGFTSRLVFSKYMETGTEASKVERRIHKKFSKDRLCKKLMTNYMQRNGHTECYKLELLHELIKEIDE